MKNHSNSDTYLSFLSNDATIQQNLITYWYSDIDIDLLLKAEIHHDLHICQAITHNQNQICIRLDEVQNMFSLNNSIVAALIPINIGQSSKGIFTGSHWVSLVITRDKQFTLQALYADSKGVSIQSSLPILKNMLDKYKYPVIFDSEVVQQHNDYDCGPWTVFNLYSLARTGDLPRGKTEHSIIEQRQLLNQLKKMNLSKEIQDILQIPDDIASTEGLDLLDEIPYSKDFKSKDKSTELSNPMKSFVSSKYFNLLHTTSLIAKDSVPKKYDDNTSNNITILLEDETLNVLEEIPQGVTNDKLKASLEPKSINMNEEDIRRIITMMTIIDQFERSEIDLQNTFIKIGDLAGGKDKISFNDSDGNCVRNKYGYIKRNKEGTQNLKGIYFEKLYHMKLILENKSLQTDSPSSCIDDLKSKSEGLQKDLFNIRDKLKQILAKEDEFLPIKYKGLFHEFKDTDEECKMENIKEFSNFHYYTLVLNRIKLESSNVEEIDFRNKEDRYYMARILTIIGEFSREYTEDNKTIPNQEMKNVFLNLKRLRNLLIHCHDKISFGMQSDKEIDSLNKNVTILLFKLTEITEGNKLRENYDYKGLNSIIQIIKNIFSRSECKSISLSKDNVLEKDKDSAISSEITDIEKIIQKSFDTFIKNPKQIKKVLNRLNNEYQEKRKGLQLNVEYPEAINEENKDVIINYCRNKSGKVMKDKNEDVNNEGPSFSQDNTTVKDTKEMNKIRGNIISSIKQAHKIIKDKPSNMCEFLNKIDKKYQDQLTILDVNDRYKYPIYLNIENESRIIDFVNSLSASRDSKENPNTTKSEKKDNEDVVMNQRKMDNKINELIKETEYLSECENRRDIKMEKKSRIIEHIVSIIGQVMRDISDLDSILKSLTTSKIHDYASRSAKLARNQGLSHDIFSFNKDWLGQQIQNNILPAYEHFQSVLTIYKMNDCKITRVTLFSIAMSFLKLGLYDEAERYFIRTLSYIAQNPDAGFEKSNELFNILFDSNVGNAFNELMGTDIYTFLSCLFLMYTYIIACKYDYAHRELIVLKSKMKLEKIMKTSDRMIQSLVYDVYNGLAHCLLIQGKNKEVIYLMNEIIPISNYPFLKVHLGSALHFENKPEEAFKVFHEILPFAFEPTLKYKALHMYVRVLSYQKNKSKSLTEASKYIGEMETLFWDNYQLFKTTYDDQFLLMQYLTVRLKVQLLVDKCLHLDSNEVTFDAMLEELEKYIRQFYNLIFDMKHDLKDDIRIPSMNFWFCRAYSSLINGNLSDTNKEKMKIEKAQYFFDKARSKFDYFRKCGRISVSSIKEMIKTADFLAYGYNKLAAREDLNEELRTEYSSRATPYMKLVKGYMSKYTQAQTFSERKIPNPKPCVDSLPPDKDYRMVEKLIIFQFLSSKIKSNCKSATLTISIKNVNKKDLENYCINELKIESEDLEFDKNTCWISLEKKNLDILRIKAEHSKNE